MIKIPACIYIDIEDGPVELYNYREPHYNAAKKMGLQFLILALKSRQFKESLKKHLEHVIYIDEFSVDSLCNKVTILQQKYNIKFVFCFAGHASRYGQIGCIVAEVCKNFGFNYSSSNAIRACNNKFLMRIMLEKHQIPSIKYGLCNDERTVCMQAERIGYPIVAKPVFGAGSAFVKKCNNEFELVNHYRFYQQQFINSAMLDFYYLEHDIIVDDQIVARYIPGVSILLEEYIEGIEGSIECIVDENIVYPLIINEKLLLQEKEATILENLLITPPVSFSIEEINKIKQYGIACINALGLKFALVHLEFRISKAGIFILEINPRLGGLYVNSAFQDIAKIDPYTLYLQLLSKSTDLKDIINNGIKNVSSANTYYSMLALYPESNGKFLGINGIEFLHNNNSILEYKIAPPQDVNASIEENYLLKCWAKIKNKDDALNLYNNLLTNIKLIIN